MTPKTRRAPVKNLVALDGTLESVAALRLAVQERGKNADPMEMRISARDAVREHVECHNPLCQAGGFSLGELLRDMVHNRRAEFVGTSFCTGQETVHPEVPEDVRSCRTRFEIQATLRFR